MIDTRSDSAMSREILDQGRVLRALTARRGSLEVLRPKRPPLGFVLVARGSSDNAATYGRYLLEMVTGRPTTSAAPSHFTRYHQHADYRGFCAVAISQSGHTPEIVEVTSRLVAAGVRTIAVTNDPASPLAEAADSCLALGAGEELAVPATKTFTATLVALAMLAELMGDTPWGEADWQVVLDGVDAVITESREVAEVAAVLAAAEGAVCLARGLSVGIAEEMALKLKEAALLRAEGGSLADFQHGPVAGYPTNIPSVLVGAGPRVRADLDQGRLWLAGSGRRVFEMSDRKSADVSVPVVHELLAPVLLAVRGQQLAVECARLRGIDPDSPAGLQKVTRTS